MSKLLKTRRGHDSEDEHSDSDQETHTTAARSIVTTSDLGEDDGDSDEEFTDSDSDQDVTDSEQEVDLTDDKENNIKASPQGMCKPFIEKVDRVVVY